GRRCPKTTAESCHLYQFANPNVGDQIVKVDGKGFCDIGRRRAGYRHVGDLVCTRSHRRLLLPCRRKSAESILTMTDQDVRHIRDKERSEEIVDLQAFATHKHALRSIVSRVA